MTNEGGSNLPFQQHSLHNHRCRRTPEQTFKISAPSSDKIKSVFTHRINTCCSAWLKGPQSVNEGSRSPPCFNSASSSSKTQTRREGSFTTPEPFAEHSSTPSVSRMRMNGMYKHQRIVGSAACLNARLSWRLSQAFNSFFNSDRPFLYSILLQVRLASLRFSLRIKTAFPSSSSIRRVKTSRVWRLMWCSMPSTSS